MKPGETPEQAKARAQRLRDHAAQARSLAGSLGTALDSTVAKATAEGVWSGPYAERVTGALRGYKGSLEGMAQGLQTSARTWESEADLLDQEAAAAARSGGK
ncbi:hypothetical protein FM076_27475 [Streptomyces albus subsp. chlorinus]|uniref:hypothetical protein n=1 Tax=Streptomyces albus TaxID=1888 RepID=UPI00156FD9A8|nr:hypothetical protein [Streptomyces albus]NSC24694.1 hypothetical protein [Streptomyces albus subsp. chlorinus]